MKLGAIKNITLDDIYWQIKYGKSVNQLNVFDLRLNPNNYIKSPIFFLSTGRCGTKWFSELFSKNSSCMVLHDPKPNLAIQSKLAYNINKKTDLKETEINLLKEIFWAAREQFLRYSYKSNKRYIETNNYISFFAPILISIFPDAKFVHLYRHPGEFVRSGIRRNYYTENNSDDLKRITPETHNDWDNYTQIEKISWLWNETNIFIENFKKTNQDKVFDFNFNNLNLDKVLDLCKFINLAIFPRHITKFLGVKSNIQKQGSFPEYDNWKNSDKESLKAICNEFVLKHTNYKL